MNGGDCAPGVYHKEDNTIRWLDDAFLGVTPRRLLEHRQRIVRENTIDQTKKAARPSEALQEMVERVGGKLPSQLNAVETWQGDPDDR